MNEYHYVTSWDDPGSRARSVVWRCAEDEREISVWLDMAGRPRARIGRINKLLVRDARRHGQDLVEELVEKALMKAERLSRNE